MLLGRAAAAGAVWLAPGWLSARAPAAPALGLKLERTPLPGDVRAPRQLDIPGLVRGVVVTDADPASPAAAAGLPPGDVIQEINRPPVASVDEAIELSRRLEGGRVLLRAWSRGGSRFVVVDATRGRR